MVAFIADLLSLAARVSADGSEEDLSDMRGFGAKKAKRRGL
jgi:hypothetical protein